MDWLPGKPDQGQAARPVATGDHEDTVRLEEARRLGEEAHRLVNDLTQVVPEARQLCWIEANRGAFEDANSFLDKFGLWSERARLF